ncbi:LacI family DNA-binding transcriptional regulator [Arthrobacter liuii]|uniref:LacI family transcriptional regulator n=1 Tax=Arthrobacter liuii TaxID=1476996 RepID=A0ABQ2AXJ1_9MICC|nr:LacI family DNA-binding transcriptional regulator [Arthrobacter liuii]GGI01263.1 LacI family transcriptional regulator [Arthrobacter liuii]
MTEIAVQPPRTPVTRKDVARYAGVSTAVVSYVVNSGPKNVAPATAARVLDAIRILGYRPNAAARALKLGSTEMLGLVLPDNSNPFFAEFAREIEIAAGNHGYALLLANSNGNVSEEHRHLRNLASRQVDGVILASNSMNEPVTRNILTSDLPTVLLNQAVPVPGMASVGADFRAGAADAVRHLIGHGHTEIALLMGAGTSTITDERELGWLDALAEAGLPEGPIARAPFTREGGYRGGQRLVRGAHRPTAVFCSSDLQAIGLLRALHEAGLSIPEDVAVVSFDGSAESMYSWPALTTVRQPLADMAAAAVNAVLPAGGKTPLTHEVFPTELIIRRSCGCDSLPTTPQRNA